ncbi:MAG: 2-oxo acid dehydrogenase subunit E2 [Chloroflexi bacterium]|nr:2-oxo acid dehydrogenase subunit E2 [Chloroflexota bacterium]
MATKVIMPQLGESVVEGTVSRWLYNVGDQVKEYEPLLEVSTDKVDTEVPAPVDGTLLKVYVQEGETVEAGVLLAVIGTPGEDVPAGDEGSSAEAATPQPEHAAPAAPAVSQGNGAPAMQKSGMRISPVVARMAAEHNLDLTQIKGTGRGGRVTKKDVQAYLSQGEAVPAATATAEEIPAWEQPWDGELFKPTGEFKEQPRAAAPPAAPAAASPPPRAIPAEPVPQGTPGEMLPLDNMRRSIADHMVHSKLHTSPHVTTIFEIDMSAVLAHRAAHKDQFAKQGINLTLTAYFVAAVVEACRAYPILNSQWTDEGVYIHHAVHVGMATAVANGLLVPVIKNAQELSLMGLARYVNDLASRARNKQLKPDELQGSTITITNHGVSGSLVATPIINQPNAAIVGVGIMEKRVKVIDDAIAIRPCVYVSLTFDHRISDGATADGWLMALKQTLENWS